MKHLLISSCALSLVVIAAAYSAFSAPQNPTSAAPTGEDLQIDVRERNPWTNLELNNQRENFQFAIVTDRTGGHRPGVFEVGIEKLNLLQPEFVVSVGDLIEGGTVDPGVWALEWSEFQSMVGKLEMPFFYLAGNHDITNQPMRVNWDRKFGRSYYHFLYHDVLFLCLNSEDPPKEGPFHFSQQQRDWAKSVLDDNRDVRWTVVLLHKPTWSYVDADLEKSGWIEIEQSLLQGDRPYTVFTGHKHSYAKFIRHGREYYMLATTGGVSRLSGKSEGEFDHIVWITMKDEGPVVANIMLDGVEDKNVRTLDDPQSGK